MITVHDGQHTCGSTATLQGETASPTPMASVEEISHIQSAASLSLANADEKVNHAKDPIEVVPDNVTDRKTRRNDDEETVCNLDEEKAEGAGEKGEDAQPPSHGRLLPLPRFLLVYACLALAVLLTSLDQTVGAW